MAEEFVTSSPDQDDLPSNIEESSKDLPTTEEIADNVVEPEIIQSMKTGHAAVLSDYISGDGIVNSYAAVEGRPDIGDLVKLLSADKSVKDRDDILNQFENSPGITSQELRGNAEAVRGMLASIEADGSRPERQIIDALSTPETAVDEAVRLEAKMLVVNTLTDLVRDYSTVEKALDIATGLLPLDIKDNIDVSGTAFGAEEFMRDVIVGLKDMQLRDPERFQEVFPEVMEELEEALPKNKLIGVVSAMLEVGGEEGLLDFNAAFAALDAVELATLGAGMALKLAKSIKQVNAIKVAADLNNTHKATEAAVATVVDTTGSSAKAAGIDEVTAVNNAQPFDVTDLDDAYAAGLSPTIVNSINKIRRSQDEIVRTVTSEEGFLREGLLDAGERTVAETKQLEELESLGFSDIKAISRTPDSTVFKYSLVEDGETLTDTLRMDLKIDDKTGVWSNTEQGTLGAWFKSPTAFAKNSLSEVQAAIRLDSTSTSVANALKRMQSEAVAPILGKRGFKALLPKVRVQMAEIDNILLEGDRMSKVFSPDELRGGVNGTKLDNDQIEAYYNLRGVYDSLWAIRNAETRRGMRAKGLREVQVQGKPQVSKIFELSGAQGLVNLTKPVRVWDGTADKSITLRQGDLKGLYDNGFVMSRLDSPISVSRTGDEFDLVLTRRAMSKDLPDKVIHFKDGYVPKVNKDAYWFVKTFGKRTINGVTQTGVAKATERFFRTKFEADDWTKQQIAVDPSRDLRVLPDRAMEQQVLGSSGQSSGGGLYTGPRASKAIPFGPDGLPAERFGAFEALSRNINSLQNFTTRNVWRMGLRQKWINSAKAAGFDIDTFEKALIPEGDPRGKGLRLLADQIDQWSGFPSKSELQWDGAVSQSIEWAIGKRFKGKDKIVDGLHNMRRTDPVGAMRAVSFHSLLGALNPAQYWVQAQGSSIALTMATTLTDPLGGIRALKNQQALAFVTHTDSPEIMKNVARAAGISAETLTEMKTLWKRTGLEESILNTADHSAAAVGLGVGGDALRRTADAGLFFYRAGELFNRRTGFLVALDRFNKANPGAKVGDEALKGILTEANNFMLNLSKANKAEWQKGIPSIPTQFLQVQAKMAETLLGSNQSFTFAERMKILSGQLALYGAAGIPLGNFFLRWASESLGLEQEDFEALPPEVSKFLNEGAWGLYALGGLGADIELGSRGAVASGLETFLTDTLFSDAPVVEKMFGAFGTIPHRFYKAYTTVKPLALGAAFYGQEVTQEEIITVLNQIGSITSTWSNAQKGMFMQHHHMLLDSRGAVVDKKDFNIGTEVGAMLGFQPSELRRVRDIDLLTKAQLEYRREMTDLLVENYWRYVKTFELADNDAERDKIVENYSIQNRVISQHVGNPGDLKKIQEALKTRIEKGETKKERAIRRFLETFNDGQVASFHNISETMAAQGILRTGILDEE